jgi:hypothetical protein
MKIILDAASQLIGAAKQNTFLAIVAAVTTGSALAATPLHHYDFNGDTVRDLVGSVDGALVGGADLDNGILRTYEMGVDGRGPGYAEFPENLLPAVPPFSIAFSAREFSLRESQSESYPGSGTMVSQGPEFSIGFEDRLFKIGGHVPNPGAPVPKGGVWHHYAVTAAADETRLYIDGNLVARFGAIFPGSVESTTRVGFDFLGSMDELWVFDGVLSQSETADLARRRDFTYYERPLPDGGIVITGYTGIAGRLTIPETIDGKPVVGIGQFAFQFYNSLTSVIIPKGVNMVGYEAFRDCSSLRSIYFLGDEPNGLIGPSWWEPEDPPSFSNSEHVTVFYPAGANGWEGTYRYRPAVEWIPTDDWDHDRMTNLEEMFAGTDPLDASSLLAFEVAPRSEALVEADQTAISADQHGLYFQTIPGLRYEILSSEVLGGPWTPAATVSATTSQKRALVNKPAGAAFYRIRVVPAQ